MHRHISKHSLPYAVGTSVIVRKLAAAKNPVTEPGSWDDWIPGEENQSSLPVDYELRGILLKRVETNTSIFVFRTHRNGVKADGIFTSTIVCSIKAGSIAITFNSIYQILGDENP